MLMISSASPIRNATAIGRKIVRSFAHIFVKNFNLVLKKAKFKKQVEISSQS